MEGHREAPGPPHVLISELCLPLPASPDGGDTRCDRPLGWAEVCADSCFLCPVAGPAGEESAAELTCRLQVCTVC